MVISPTAVPNLTEYGVGPERGIFFAALATTSANSLPHISVVHRQATKQTCTTQGAALSQPSNRRFR